MDPGRLGARIARTVGRLLAGPARKHPSATRRTGRSGTGTPTRPRPASPSAGPSASPRAPGDQEFRTGYPGDFTGVVDIEYSPDLDGDPDPGEVVWGWIPYEDDYRRGKDRPALVIGRDGGWLLALMLTSRDKDRSEGAQRRHEVWMDIGSGSWDRERRPSEVRIDRVIRLAEASVRREGAILGRRIFAAVAEAVREHGPAVAD